MSIAILAGAITSCDSILNYNEDCDIEYCVKFKYDYNMEEKDVFAEQVRSVTLYAFDENNNLVYQNTDQGEQLGDIDYAMNIAGIDPSQCRLIVWAGLNNESFAVPLLYPDQSKIEELNVKTLRKQATRSTSEEEKGKYSHRNYLGGIVKLGLKREKVGDILVFNNGADIITFVDFANTLKTELGSLTRFQNSKIIVDEISKIRKQEIKIEEVKIIVPSLRLDNIVSDLAKTSRSKAVQIMEAQRVFVNGKNEIKASKQIKQNDIITIRGKGRFIIKEFTGTTRSGRTVILVEKYI